MKIFKSFRNSSLIISISVCFLIFSCSQYEINNQKFDYSIYEAYKLANIHLSNNSSNRTSVQDLRNVLIQANNEYGTNIFIPNNILSGMLTETTVPEIKAFVKSEGLLNNLDVVLISNFIEDFETNSFEDALESFEDAVIAENLSQAEFDKLNLIANSFEIMNDENSTFFDNAKASGPLSCIWTYVLWLASVVAAFVACAGPQAIFLCVLALI
jgi:hypothetical protein